MLLAVDGGRVFSPLSEVEAKEALLNVVRRSPITYGYETSRWQLSLLIRHCEWVKVETVQGFWSVMRRLEVHYKASCQYVHSPDVDYEAKWAIIEQVVAKVYEEDVVVVCLDELTFYNQPSLADTYAQQGKEQTKAHRALGSTKSARVVGALNMLTGQVNFALKSKITVPNFIAFLQQLVAQYPNKRIFIIIDNWPVHYHPNVLAAVQKQVYGHYFRCPDSWKDVKVNKKYQDLELPIQFVPLPTYASWLNPIEKLWRWLKQDVIHVHNKAEKWQDLKNDVSVFLQRFNELSDDLLSYVGINNPKSKYGKILFNNSA
jgi:transposase